MVARRPTSGKPAIGGKVRKEDLRFRSYRDEAELRSAVRRGALARFSKIFGREYDPEWGATLLASFAEARQQEDAAREAMKWIARTPNKARQVVRAFGLDSDPVRPGTAPALLVLALVAGNASNEQLKRLRLSELEFGRMFGSFRACIVEVFEVLKVAVPAPVVAAGPRWNQGAGGAYDERVSNNGELAAISIVLGPEAYRVTKEDLVAPNAVSVVTRREKKSMEDARRVHGVYRAPPWGRQPPGPRGFPDLPI